MKLKVKINGKTYEAEKGEYVLEVCRRNRVLVPTLCHHESLSGLGACRLCVVEVNEGKGKQVVVSCVYPLSRDCEVFTESEKIKGIRRTILSMLKTRAPSGYRLASLCQIYGVKENDRFTAPGAGKRPALDRMSADRISEACVLCGLCVQACTSLGTGAISTAGRGVAKNISTPFGEPSTDCIGCGSCASVCPTKAIVCSEGKSFRSIWGKKFKLLRCASCGKAFATEEEYAYALHKAELEKANAESAAPGSAESGAICDAICETCRRKKSADVFAGAFGERV